MNKVTFEIRKHYDTDVLVVGGGPAGLAAAVCAARRGAKVMLCEKEGALGGAPGVGMIGPFMPSFDPEGNVQVFRGFFEEFVRRMEAEGGAIHPSKVEGATGYASYRTVGHAHVTPYDCEVFKRVAEEMCLESGVKLLYNVYFQTCETENGNITGAVFSGKGGFFEVRARQYIDCSGDADLAYQAGAPCETGRDNDGVTQPVSLFFLIDGVEKAPMDKWVEDHKDDYSRWFFEAEVTAARERGEYTVPRHNVEIYEEIDGAWRVNMSRVNGVDGTDPEQITEALIRLRRQIPEIIAFLRKTVPGCENARLRTSSCMLGVRETRRIKGKYMLDVESLENAVPFDDVIFMGGNLVDIHVNVTVNYNRFTFRDPYSVPYRVLLPQKIGNLLVAGRCVSATREAHGAIRVIPPCFAMGQAAGTAAALCVKQGISPENVNVRELQRQLHEDGVILYREDIR